MKVQLKRNPSQSSNCETVEPRSTWAVTSSLQPTSPKSSLHIDAVSTDVSNALENWTFDLGDGLWFWNAVTPTCSPPYLLHDHGSSMWPQWRGTLTHWLTVRRWHRQVWDNVVACHHSSNNEYFWWCTKWGPSSTSQWFLCCALWSIHHVLIFAYVHAEKSQDQNKLCVASNKRELILFATRYLEQRSSTATSNSCRCAREKWRSRTIDCNRAQGFIYALWNWQDEDWKPRPYMCTHCNDVDV